MNISKRKFIAVTALALASGRLLSQDQKPDTNAVAIKPKAALVECIFVTIILVVAGFVIYKVIKWCRKYLGNDTNMPPGTISNIVNRDVVSLTALPPIMHGPVGPGDVSFQSSADLKHWVEYLTYSVTFNTDGTVRVVARHEGTVIADKTLPVILTSDGPSAIMDITVETAPLFPNTEAVGAFRLLSIEPTP